MAEKRAQRRLAAILATDVVGYSRLIGADEEGTLAALKAHRRELTDPKVEQHHGRIVKTTGDGALIEFASVVDAVRCAVDVQRGMAERNLGVRPDKRIEFRIGINVGDIVIDGDDILGDGVNIAARLEGLAEPGGVLVSRAVRDQVRDRLELAFEDLGERELKNIARPVRVYRVQVLAGSIAAPARGGALPLPDKPSITVLPFTNMSGDAEHEYFADGIAEDIITGLSRLRWLFVIARNSSFVYKGRNVDVRQVGRELGVRYILEGSVRKGGSQVRITGQLVDAETGNHLWAERYDRITSSPAPLSWTTTTRKPMACARSALHGARIRVGRIERRPLQKSLKGPIARWRAIPRNPGLILRMASSLWPSGVIPMPSVHSAGPSMRVPNFAYAHGLLGCAHSAGGRPERAIECIDRGVRLSPRDIFGDEYQLYYAFAHFQAGRYAEAASAALLGIQQRSDHPVLYIMAAASFGLGGETDKAKGLVTQLTGLVPNVSAAYFENDFFYCQQDDRSRLAMGLRAGGLPG